MSERIFAAMSGGVDSSVAALLLKESGYDVVGVGLKLLGEDSLNSCCSAADMADARRAADVIGIPFYVLDFEEEFNASVIDYFSSSYARGETPNPCIPCNKELKFDSLLRIALSAGADGLATGHYARVSRDSRSGRFRLHKGIDAAKDQSYFLYSLSQPQLGSAHFPLGGMTKSEARAVAREAGLGVHDKPESQDVCFVDGPVHEFVERTHPDAGRPGPVYCDGRVIGSHRGIARYTVGQRRGLDLGGTCAMYVSDIDPVANAVTVVPADKCSTDLPLRLSDVNYVSIDEPAGPVKVQARTRYRGAEVEATLVPLGGGEAVLEFHSEREPVAPGQSAVMYDGDVVVAGGIARRSNGG